MLIDLDQVCRTVAQSLGRRHVAPGHRLVEDLGADSVDLLNLVVTFERKFGVSIDEEATATISTVRDLHAVASTSAHARPGTPDAS